MRKITPVFVRRQSHWRRSEYTYDQSGNITSSVKGDTSEQFSYDENNRLVSYNGSAVSYDADGNMISGLGMTLVYDSANRLTSAGGNTYTYDAENIRAKNLCGDKETEYTYNTNAELTQLLYTVENDGTVTRYIYGMGLIGEVSGDGAKVYHFDYRGSTAAVTDKDGNITDTFTYDTYGKLTERIGTSEIIFLYNGRDGVVTDQNGLLYMRARYYSPDLKRFVNMDIIAGEITDPVTLNRYAYANGNPVSNIDPFGLSAERGQTTESKVNVNYAIYVVDYDIGPGLPIIGHSKIYFLDEKGNWHLTEFTGEFPDKSTAEVFLYSPEKSINRLKNDISRINDNLKPLHLNGTDFLLLQGNFTESLALAQYYYENQNYPGYSVFTNNCLHYIKNILDVADIKGAATQFYVNNDSNIIIPYMYFNGLKNAQKIDSTLSSVKDFIVDFVSDYGHINSN